MLLGAAASLAVAQQQDSSVDDTSGSSAIAKTEQASRPGITETPDDASQGERTRLNLLGEVDSRSGESQRNENVRLTLIDNNVLK